MATATAPATPAAAPAPKKEKPPKQVLFPTAEAAVEEAQNRVKGPRRAFRTELNGKTLFVVHNNEGRAGGVAFEQAGGKVEELGKTRKAKAPLGVDGILAAVNGLPEAERKAVMEQLKGLLGAKKA